MDFPLALARVQMQVGRASLERVAAELRASFAGRTLSLSWIHGDFVPGNVLAGPALVDGSDTTVWLPHGARARVDDYGTLVMEVAMTEQRA